VVLNWWVNTPAKDDVLILGAGAVGLATALALLEAGRGVRMIEAREVGAGASHGNCGTITPSHAPPLAAPGVIGRALRWMLRPDAPLYVKPRIDPALWRWLLAFASRCNRDDWLRSTTGRAAILDDSRARLAEWIGRYRLECEFGEDGLDYVFRDRRNFEHYVKECADLETLGIATEVIGGADYRTGRPCWMAWPVPSVSRDAHLRPDRYVAELARVVRSGGVIEELPRAGRAHGAQRRRGGHFAGAPRRLRAGGRARRVVAAAGQVAGIAPADPAGQGLFDHLFAAGVGAAAARWC
jgi:D-amino-acid dehydrogenase